MRRISDETLAKITELLGTGMSVRKIAVVTKTSRDTISKIRCGKHISRREKVAMNSTFVAHPDAGSKIPGSKMIRAYCIRCDGAMRVSHIANVKTAVCTDCTGPLGAVRRLGGSDDDSGDMERFYR